MKIPYFSESAYIKLFDEIPLNIQYYSSSNRNEWLKIFFGNSKYYKESRIDAVLPKLSFGSTPDIEYSNVIVLYGSLKDKLTPRQASNPLLWSYLTHFFYWDYTIDRWFKRETIATQEMIKQRFFCNSEQGNRIGFLRNSVSRFWWIGYLTYDTKGQYNNPYELTKLMLSNSDLTQSIIERNFSMNRNITNGILSAIKEINDDPRLDNVGVLKAPFSVSSSQTYEWRELCKFINRYGAVTLLDTMSSEEIRDLSKQFLFKLRGIIS